MFCWTQLGKCWASLYLAIFWESSYKPERLSTQSSVVQRQGEAGPWHGHSPGFSCHTHFMIKSSNMKTESCSCTFTEVSHVLVPWLRAQGLHCPFSSYLTLFLQQQINFHAPLISSIHLEFQGEKKPHKLREQCLGRSVRHYLPGLLDCMFKWGWKLVYK